MIPLPSILGVIGLMFVVLEGAFFGTAIWFVGKRFGVRGWPPYLIHLVLSVTGFLLGMFLNILANEHLVEVNGQFVGWNSGGSWIGIRAWLLRHIFAAQVSAACALIMGSWRVNLLRMPRRVT
jgi:hypothetical protein